MVDRVTTAWIFIATVSAFQLQDLVSASPFFARGDAMKNQESDTEFTDFPSIQTVTKNLTCHGAHSLETIILGKQLLRTNDLKADIEVKYAYTIYDINTQMISIVEGFVDIYSIFKATLTLIYLLCS